MIVPQQVPVSNVPVAGVYTLDGVVYLFKLDAGHAVDLSTGAQQGIPSSNPAVTYFPKAALSLG